MFGSKARKIEELEQRIEEYVDLVERMARIPVHGQTYPFRNIADNSFRNTREFGRGYFVWKGIIEQIAKVAEETAAKTAKKK
jgi:hypothetical protein